jgi:hypothetical protein
VQKDLPSKCKALSATPRTAKKKKKGRKERKEREGKRRQEKKNVLYTYKYYLTIKKSKVTLARKWVGLDHHIKQNKQDSHRHVFFHIWNLDFLKKT